MLTTFSFFELDGSSYLGSAPSKWKTLCLVYSIEVSSLVSLAGGWEPVSVAEQIRQHRAPQHAPVLEAGAERVASDGVPHDAHPL